MGSGKVSFVLGTDRECILSWPTKLSTWPPGSGAAPAGSAGVGDTLSLEVCWTRTGRSPCRTGNHFLSAKENGTRSILIRGSVARVFVEEEEEDGTFNSRRD
ncbi:uncharacterized protein LOC119766732 [Culex quinquefasciatus]|uniref:uncharacterized protein LOC119766732 n=1 Tax=Culex quinquefasciatus TaxID=7176 RepID=UPI0018E2EBA8|nr:uncharacterized protein LOC119766732 [Culex quinquefasciatus]